MEKAPSNEGSDLSEGSDASLDSLEQDLARAHAELAEYQALIDELPGIYETKFRYQVQALAQDIRRLLDERRDLQEHLDSALPPVPAPRALPAAPLEPVQPSSLIPKSRRRRPASLRLRRWRRRIDRGWQYLHQSVNARMTSLRRPLPSAARLPLVAVATALGVAMVVVVADALHRQGAAPPPQTPSRPAPVPPPRSEVSAGLDQDLLLRARGVTWLEVQTLEGKVVHFDTVQKGEQQRIKMREGLRIRAGRPDLLDVAVDDGAFQVLNPIGELGWKIFRPDVMPRSPSNPSATGPRQE